MSSGRSRMAGFALALATVLAAILIWNRLASEGAKEVQAPPPPRQRWSGEPVSDLAARTRPAPAEGAERSPTGRTASLLEGYLRVCGTVRDGEGNPIPGALVYLLPKGFRGAHGSTDVPTAGTGKDGRYRLLTKRLRGCWLGAIADGYFPAFVDSDDVRPELPADFTLREGSSILVRVRGGETSGVATRAEILSSPEKHGLWTLPGPGYRRSVCIFRPVPDDGRLVIRVGSTDPVEVRVYRNGWFCVPPVVKLSCPEGKVEFTLYRSCGIRVRVTDAVTGDPIDGWVRMDVLDPRSGKEINGILFRNSFGEGELADRLPPGSYEIRVSSRGYRTWIERGFELVDPGKRHDLAVALRPDDRLVRLRLHATVEGRPARGVRSILRWSRRTGGNPPAGETAAVSDYSWDGDAAVLELLVDPSRRASFMVWDSGGRTALVAAGSATPGAVVSREVSLEEGLVIPVPRLKNGTGGTLVSLVLRTDGGERVPLVRKHGGSLEIYRNAADLPGEVLLGPYPLDHLVSEALYEDGSLVREAHVRPGSK